VLEMRVEKAVAAAGSLASASAAVLRKSGAPSDPQWRSNANVSKVWRDEICASICRFVFAGCLFHSRPDAVA
jgi:hypothetical protein